MIQEFRRTILRSNEPAQTKSPRLKRHDVFFILNSVIASPSAYGRHDVASWKGFFWGPRKEAQAIGCTWKYIQRPIVFICITNPFGWLIRMKDEGSSTHFEDGSLIMKQQLINMYQWLTPSGQHLAVHPETKVLFPAMLLLNWFLKWQASYLVMSLGAKLAHKCQASLDGDKGARQLAL